MTKVGKSNIVSSFYTMNDINPKSGSTFILVISQIILEINYVIDIIIIAGSIVSAFSPIFSFTEGQYSSCELFFLLSISKFGIMLIFIIVKLI